MPRASAKVSRGVIRSIVRRHNTLHLLRDAAVGRSRLEGTPSGAWDACGGRPAVTCNLADHFLTSPPLEPLTALWRGGPVYESHTSRLACNNDGISWPAVGSCPGQLGRTLDGEATHLWRPL